MPYQPSITGKWGTRLLPRHSWQRRTEVFLAILTWRCNERAAGTPVWKRCRGANTPGIGTPSGGCKFTYCVFSPSCWVLSLPSVERSWNNTLISWAERSVLVAPHAGCRLRVHYALSAWWRVWLRWTVFPCVCALWAYQVLSVIT